MLRDLLVALLVLGAGNPSVIKSRGAVKLMHSFKVRLRRILLHFTASREENLQKVWLVLEGLRHVAFSARIENRDPATCLVFCSRIPC